MSTKHTAIFERVPLPKPHWTIRRCSCGYQLTSQNPDSEFIQHFATATLGDAVEPHRQLLNAAGYPYGDAPQHTVSPKPDDPTVRHTGRPVSLARRMLARVREHTRTGGSLAWDRPWEALLGSEREGWYAAALEALAYAKELAD